MLDKTRRASSRGGQAGGGRGGPGPLPYRRAPPVSPDHARGRLGAQHHHHLLVWGDREEQSSYRSGPRRAGDI